MIHTCGNVGPIECARISLGLAEEAPFTASSISSCQSGISSASQSYHRRRGVPFADDRRLLLSRAFHSPGAAGRHLFRNKDKTRTSHRPHVRSHTRRGVSECSNTIDGVEILFRFMSLISGSFTDADNLLR